MLNHKTVLSLTFLYSIFVIVWVQPFTESPINDDWAYLLTVKFFHENNTWYFSYWPSMTLVGQSFFGIIFSKIMGFSIVKIRLLTFSLSIFSLLLTYFLTWRISKSLPIALIAWIIACVFPFTMHLSLSFMTEIYEWFGVLCSLLLFQILLSNQRKSIWILLIFSCLFTVLVRQTSLVFPLSIFLVAVVSENKKLSVKWSMLNLLLCIAAISICQNWQLTIQPEIRAHGVDVLFKNVFNHFPSVYLERIFGIVQLIGFFLILITFIYFKTATIHSNWKVSFLMLLLLTPIFYFGFGNFPYGNTFTLFEWGPRFLKDTPTFTNVSDLPKSVRVVIHGFSLFSVVFWVSNLYNYLKNQEFRLTFKINPFTLLLVLLIGFNVIIHLLVPVFFDRHLFLTLQLLFILILTTQSTQSRFTSKTLMIKSAIVFVLFLSLNLGMNKSYFTWLNAQKELSDIALKFTSAKNIDGGQIFNGWHQTASKTYQNHGVSWYHVNNDDWVICNNFNERRTIKKLKVFERNLGVSSDTLLLLKQN